MASSRHRTWGGIDDPWVWSLAVKDGALIVGGLFTTAGGIETGGIARWDGTSWSDVLGDVDAGAYDLALWSGGLAACGSFRFPGDVWRDGALFWDGGAWTELGRISRAALPAAMALEVYNDDLILGGRFQSVDGVDALDVARFDGVSWAPLGSGIPVGMFTETVFAITAHDGHLYFGGGFYRAGQKSSRCIARWDDLVPTPHSRATLSRMKEPSASPLAVWVSPEAAGLHLHLDRAADVRLDLYDVQGRLLGCLQRGRQSVGDHRIDFGSIMVEGHHPAGGIYFYRIKADGTSLTGRALILR